MVAEMIKLTEYKLEHLRTLASESSLAITLNPDTITALINEIDELKEAQARHLGLIKKMSIESIDEAQAEEMKGQIAALIAAVGTKRAEEKFGMSGVLCTTCGANIGEGENNCEMCIDLFEVAP